MFNLQLSLSSGVWPPYVSCIESGHNIYKWGATHTKLAALEWTFLAGGEMRNACTNSLPYDFESVASPFWSLTSSPEMVE